MPSSEHGEDMSCGADNALLEEVGSARGLVVSSMDDDRLQPHELACTQGGEQRPASQDGTCGMVQSEGVMRRGDFSPKKCVEICGSGIPVPEVPFSGGGATTGTKTSVPTAMTTASRAESLPGTSGFAFHAVTKGTACEIGQVPTPEESSGQLSLAVSTPENAAMSDLKVMEPPASSDERLAPEDSEGACLTSSVAIGSNVSEETATVDTVDADQHWASSSRSPSNVVSSTSSRALSHPPSSHAHALVGGTAGSASAQVGGMKMAQRGYAGVFDSSATAVPVELTGNGETRALAGPCHQDPQSHTDGWEDWMGPGGEGEVKTGITQAAPEDIAKPSASDAVPPTTRGRDQGVSKHDDDSTLTKNVEGVQGATESQSNMGDGAGQAGSERASASSHKPAYSGSLANPWALRNDLGAFGAAGGGGGASPKSSSRDPDSFASPCKKVGGREARKHRQGEQRTKALSIQRVKRCLLALEGPHVTANLMPNKRICDSRSPSSPAVMSPDIATASLHVNASIPSVEKASAPSESTGADNGSNPSMVQMRMPSETTAGGLVDDKGENISQEMEPTRKVPSTPERATVDPKTVDGERRAQLRQLKDKLLQMVLPWKPVQGVAVPMAALEAEHQASASAIDKERALALQEGDKEDGIGSARAGLWIKKKNRLKLDYNKHSDYGSWFLTKFKGEFVALKKGDAFDDVRAINGLSLSTSSSHAAHTVERTMRGRERKMPKHMRDNGAAWHQLIPTRAGRKGKDAAAGAAKGAQVSSAGGRAGGGSDSDSESKEDTRRSVPSVGLSIRSRTTLMTHLPAGWSGRAVTRQSSSQADIWILAPDGTKLRSVVDVDNWYAQRKKVLSRAERKLFEDSCRLVRRKAAKLHLRQMGRAVSSDDEDNNLPFQSGVAGYRSGGAVGKNGASVSPRISRPVGSGQGETDQGSRELKTICWDCKKGKFAQKHFSRWQCREVHGHSACDWRQDPRQLGQPSPPPYDQLSCNVDGTVRMGEGGQCTKCKKVWVEEEEGRDDMRENGVLVCEDCRTEPLTFPGRGNARGRDDTMESDTSNSDEEEEEVYEAKDDETVAEISTRLGCDMHEMLRVNKPRYAGLTLNARLMAGTLLLLPEGPDEGRKQPQHLEPDLKRNGLGSTGVPLADGCDRRKRGQRDQFDGDDAHDVEAYAPSGDFTTAHGHRRWGNRWGSGVIDPRCHGLSDAANQPMHCSYDRCAMPSHSGRGDGEHGWKIVTAQTRAGNQDWSGLIGRVFCNACFMQYATRGTLVRPGRGFTEGSSPSSHSAKPVLPPGSSSKQAVLASDDSTRRSRLLQVQPGSVSRSKGSNASAKSSESAASKDCGRARAGVGRKRQDKDQANDEDELRLFRSHHSKRGPRCCLRSCPNVAGDGGRWMLVNEKTNAGARDWSRHVGRTFCKACFLYFANSGSFVGRGRLDLDEVDEESSEESDSDEDDEDDEDDADDDDEEAASMKGPASSQVDKKRGAGYRKCGRCGVYCHWTQKCCDAPCAPDSVAGTAEGKKVSGERANDDAWSSLAPPAPAKKARVDAGFGSKGGDPSADGTAEGRSRRAAAQGAAGAWSLLKSKRGVGPDDACKALSAARPATLGNNADEDLKEGIDKNHEKSSADGGDVSGGGGSECAIAIGDGMPSQGIMRTPVPSPKEQISGKSSNPPKGEKPRGLGIHSKEPRKSCPVCKKVQCTCKVRKQIVQQILENHGLHKEGINPAQGPSGKTRDEPQDSNVNSMPAGGGAGKLQIAPSVCLSGKLSASAKAFLTARSVSGGSSASGSMASPPGAPAASPLQGSAGSGSCFKQVESLTAEPSDAKPSAQVLEEGTGEGQLASP